MGELSPDHERLAVTGLFEPAVWKDHEVEKVLMDTVLHEVGVRGNAWSTVRVQMYSIRHHNVSKGMPNPLSNKLRYDQLMRALKKFRGHKAGKSLATRAMLFALCKELNWETDLDDLIQYTVVLPAFLHGQDTGVASDQEGERSKTPSSVHMGKRIQASW